MSVYLNNILMGNLIVSNASGPPPGPGTINTVSFIRTQSVNGSTTGTSWYSADGYGGQPASVSFPYSYDFTNPYTPPIFSALAPQNNTTTDQSVLLIEIDTTGCTLPITVSGFEQSGSQYTVSDGGSAGAGGNNVYAKITNTNTGSPTGSTQTITVLLTDAASNVLNFVVKLSDVVPTTSLTITSISLVQFQSVDGTSVYTTNPPYNLVVDGVSGTLPLTLPTGYDPVADVNNIYGYLQAQSPNPTSIINFTTSTLVGGSGYVDGSYTAVPLTGGTGSGATADINVSGGSVILVNINSPGSGYSNNDTVSASAANLGGSGSGFSIQALTGDSVQSVALLQVNTSGRTGSLVVTGSDSGNAADGTTYTVTSGGIVGGNADNVYVKITNTDVSNTILTQAHDMYVNISGVIFQINFVPFI